MKKILLAAALFAVAAAAKAQYQTFSYDKVSTEKNPPDITSSLVDYLTAHDPATILTSPCTSVGPPTWQILCKETMEALAGMISTVTPASSDTVFLIHSGTLSLSTVSDIAAGGGGGAPTDAVYITGATHAGLSAERVATSTTSITVDLGTAAQALFKRAALTGDVTASADSNTTTIAANSITTGKIADGAVALADMADVATDTIFCRDTAGTGIPELCTLGAGLAFTSANVLGRPALTGDVTASANSNATTIAANAVTTGKIADGTVALADMADIATNRLIGRATAATGVPEALTIGTTLGTSGTTLDRAALTGDVTASAGSNATTIAANAVTTGKIADGTVALADMADLPTDVLIGRQSGTGVPEQISASGGVEFTTNAIQTSAFTGDVTKAAGGTAQTISTTLLNGQTTKTTPVFADSVWLADSAASGVNKKATVSSIGGYQVAKLASDITRNTSAVTDVTGLTVPMVTAHIYDIRCYFYVSSATSTTGIKIGATWPAVTVGNALLWHGVNASTALGGELIATGDTRSGTDTPGDNVKTIIFLTASFIPSADGNFQIQWANETGSVTVTMYTGSHCTWQDVP